MSTSTAFFSFKKYPLIVVCLALILTACGGGDNMLSLSGTIVDSTGAAVANATVTIHSDPIVVHTDAHGFFSCRIPAGKHHIRAEKEGRVFLDKDFDANEAGGHHDMGEVWPWPTTGNFHGNATLSSIAVTPPTATVAIGQTSTFAATGTYSDATTADITAQATWSSSDTAIATIGASTGIAAGVAGGGPVTITATYAATNGVVSGTASLTVSQPVLVQLDPVAPLYPSNGANWNDYVSGNDWKTASDTACNASSDVACLHGGERRVVVAAGQTSCSGLTASDDLDAFNWVCDASTGTARLISTGLADGKNLSDLIDFSGSGSFKPNKVTVYANGNSWNTTPSTVWWTNTISINNSGADLTNPSTIYLVTSDPAAPFTVYADKVALVIEPGVTVTAPANTSGNVITLGNYAHVWLEGNVDATSNDQYGVYLSTHFSMLRNLEVVNGRYGGIFLDNAVNNTLLNVTARNNSYAGFSLSNVSKNNVIKNLTSSNNSGNGVYLANSTNNAITGLRASNNGGSGVFLDNGAADNILADVTASNSGGSNGGVYLYGAWDNTLTNLTVSGNSTYGLYLYAAPNNVIAGLTASNNTSMGVWIGLSANYNTLTGVTLSNNGSIGLYLGSSSNTTLADLASSNNNYGIYVSNSSNNTFTGLLKVGTNTTQDCYVVGGTSPGLDNTCTSAATLTSGITLANSFVGKVTSDDAANAGDASGAASFPAAPAAFDWASFDNGYRGWGLDGSAFPAANDQGRWISGSGRIWDWSLLATDTVIRGVLSVPTGNDTITHTWSDSSTTTYLRNAVEIAGDGIGNDNGLCESGETCRYTPNIGSYQGSGNLVSAGAFTGGALTGIILMNYSTNGEAAQ